MRNFPASRPGPARLEGIQTELTLRPCRPGGPYWVLRRSTAWLSIAVIAAGFFFLGAFTFGSALVAQHLP